jgi:mRNA interferase MazF
VKIQRGEIIRVQLDPAEGSEQAGERPAIVLSPDIINQHSPVIIIAAITSKKVDKIYPFEVLLEPPEGGLVEKSKALLLHLRSVDKKRILGKYGTLSENSLAKIEEALKIAVGLKKI